MTERQETIPGTTAILEGASNFRDFGGVPAFSGARVRTRQLFRSNKLSALTDAEGLGLSDASLAALRERLLET